MKLKMLNGTPVDITIKDGTARSIEEIMARIGPPAFARLLESYAAFVLDQTMRTVASIAGAARAEDVINRGVMNRCVERNIDQLVTDIFETVSLGADRDEEFRRVKAAIFTNVARVVTQTIQAENLHIGLMRIGA